MSPRLDSDQQMTSENRTLDWDSICSLSTSSSTDIWAVAAINSPSFTPPNDNSVSGSDESPVWRVKQFAQFSIHPIEERFFQDCATSRLG